MDAITLTYSSLCLQCPIGVRAHFTRGIASSWAWSSGVSISEMCEAAGWSSRPHLQGFTTWTSLSYRPESFLLKLVILWVHNEPTLFKNLLHLVCLYYMDARYQLYGTTPRPRMTLWLNLCLVYSIDSPRSYSHVSLGFESFHVITRRDCTCSHTASLDAVRVKYRKGVSNP